MGSITLWRGTGGGADFAPDIWYFFKARAADLQMLFDHWIFSDYRISSLYIYFWYHLFYIWYRACDVECLGKYLCDQKLILTNSEAFQIISEKFPGKWERILCAEIWPLGCVEAWKPPWDHSFTPRQMTSGRGQAVNPWPEVGVAKVHPFP